MTTEYDLENPPHGLHYIVKNEGDGWLVIDVYDHNVRKSYIDIIEVCPRENTKKAKGNENETLAIVVDSIDEHEDNDGVFEFVYFDAEIVNASDCKIRTPFDPFCDTANHWRFIETCL